MIGDRHVIHEIWNGLWKSRPMFIENAFDALPWNIRQMPSDVCRFHLIEYGILDGTWKGIRIGNDRLRDIGNEIL